MWSSAIYTLIVYYLCGTFFGIMLHSSDKHHYECACDQGPTLTILEGHILGVIYLAIILFGLNYILRKLKFDLIERIVALIILFLSNLYICYLVGSLLCSPPIS